MAKVFLFPARNKNASARATGVLTHFCEEIHPIRHLFIDTQELKIIRKKKVPLNYFLSLSHFTFAHICSRQNATKCTFF
jgi:hypothetical protein